MPFVVRDATLADYPVFARLLPELGVPDPTPTPAEFESNMLPRVLLLEDDGDPIAYAFWRPYGKTAHVVHLVVAPNARRRGAGGVLLDAVRERAMGAGCTRWYLNVKRENTPAIRLYERNGFAHEEDVWALCIAWRDVDGLAGESGTTAYIPQVPEYAALAERFGFEAGRLLTVSSRAGCIILALSLEAALTDSHALAARAPVAVAAFDPAHPGAYPFAVDRPSLARPLLEAMRAHALVDRFDFVRVSVMKDRALVDALRAAGAEVVFELMRMGATLA
jgi:GNAT superfamily N-acetyltransferase